MCKLVRTAQCCSTRILAFFSTLREPSVNRTDFIALTLVGPTRNNLVLKPLAVLHLDNQLFMMLLNVLLLQTDNFKTL